MTMSKNEQQKQQFHCDFCGWEGLDVVSQEPYLCCGECGYPICAYKHTMDYLVPNAQARFIHRPH